MTIESTGWTARQSENVLRVEGTVTVAHPGIEPVLARSRLQDRSFNLNLDLNLQTLDGSFIQVLTQKQVVFEMTTSYDVPVVSVFHEGNRVSQLLVEHSVN